MKRVINLMGVVFIATAAIITFLVASLWFFLPTSELVHWAVENYFTKSSGLKVSIKSSKISYSFPFAISILLAGLEVIDSHSNLIFSSETVTLSPSMGGLLKREVIIKSMTFDGFSTSIARNVDGNITIPIVAAYKKVTGNLIEEKPKNGDTKNQTITSDQPRRLNNIHDQITTNLNWQLQNIYITNSRVDWIDRKDSSCKEIVIPLTDIKGFLSHKSLDKTIYLNLDAALGDKKTDKVNVKIQGSVGIDWSVTSVTAAKLDVFSQSPHTGLFAHYLSNIPAALNVRGVDLHAALSLEPNRDSKNAFHASVVARRSEEIVLKFTSTGYIKDPFSPSPFLDLTAELFSRTELIQSAVSNGAKKWQMRGSVIVKTKLKGNFDQLIVDTLADCSQASVLLSPAFSSCMLSVKKASARVQITRIGSKNLKFNGSGTLSLNFKELSSNISKRNIKLHIEGSAPFVVKFSGDSSRVKWSLNSDLKHLNMSTVNGFRKPDGAEAHIEAAGKWSAAGLNLDTSLLRVPGLRAKTRGVLIDTNDRFGNLDILMETDDVGSIVSHNPAFSRIGISGPVRASILIRNTEYGVLNSGRVHITSVSCIPDKAFWGIKNMTGTVEFNGQTIDIRDLAGKVTGYIEAPFRLKGTLRDIGSLQTLTGNISLKTSRGKVRADRIVQILTEAHSLLGKMIKPRPVSMDGMFIQFDIVRADMTIKSGRATTSNFRMKGQEITSAAVGSIEIGSLELAATLGIHTNVVGSETLEAVPIIGELMQRHKDSLLKIPVTVFAGISGSLFSGLATTPLQSSNVDTSTLKKLETLIKQQN